MKTPEGYIIINRDQCIYCDQFQWCKYRLWEGRPADCPKLTKQRENKVENHGELK